VRIHIQGSQQGSHGRARPRAVADRRPENSGLASQRIQKWSQRYTVPNLTDPVRAKGVHDDQDNICGFNWRPSGAIQFSRSLIKTDAKAYKYHSDAKQATNNNYWREFFFHSQNQSIFSLNDSNSVLNAYGGAKRFFWFGCKKENKITNTQPAPLAWVLEGKTFFGYRDNTPFVTSKQRRSCTLWMPCSPR
jgi:hypothetical protein